MGVININVSPEKLRSLSDYVSKFGSYVTGDCDALRSAHGRVSGTMDDASSAEILGPLNGVTKILEDAQPELQKLKSHLDSYAQAVDALKRLAGG